MSLPTVTAAAMPREVRAATPERRRDYTAALGFERQLVSELTKVLDRTSGSEKADGGAEDLLPGAMADALIEGGGMGLALDLSKSQAR
ncbi:MAG: hypothetical protein H0U79_04800 [Solirubrobacterales bacterium]|nr:hypothetical protein [Solirubrobacterales bacterium]